MARKLSAFHYVVSVTLVLIVASLGYAAWYGYQEVQLLKSELVATKADIASTTLLLKDDIAAAQEKLAKEVAAQQQTTDAKIGSVSDRVGSISGTVDTLQKLSETDPQLLAKYSKVFFLNEHYAPERTVPIAPHYVYSTTRSESIEVHVWPHLQSMLSAASSSNIALYVKSAYRPFDEQKALKNEYTVVYGAGTANQFSADQGYSEHQLGTTVDFISTGQGGALAGFERTAAYAWLLGNAYQYGFILSYPQNNGYYIFEPWHWRYVGVALATYLHNSGKNFYDLDQREIDTYLVRIFE